MVVDNRAALYSLVLNLSPVREATVSATAGDQVVLRPRPSSFTQAMQGLHQEVWADPDAWLEKERAAWEE